MRLYGSVTGSESASDEYHWRSRSLLFYLSWGTESPGVNSGSGVLAEDSASYFESTQYVYGYPDFWSSLHDSTTWTFDALTLTGLEIRQPLRQERIVPEPATLLLLGAGVTGLTLRRIRRRK